MFTPWSRAVCKTELYFITNWSKVYKGRGTVAVSSRPAWTVFGGANLDSRVRPSHHSKPSPMINTAIGKPQAELLLACGLACVWVSTTLSRGTVLGPA